MVNWCDCCSRELNASYYVLALSDETESFFTYDVCPSCLEMGKQAVVQMHDPSVYELSIYLYGVDSMACRVNWRRDGF
jgi:hypothetical protein